MGSLTYDVAARFFWISKVIVQMCARFYTEMCPLWSILVQENIAPVDGYVNLVHIFKRRLTWHGTSRNHLYVKIEKYARNEVHLTYD